MSAPKYIPQELSDRPRERDATPPAGHWTSHRPADFTGRQPSGDVLGSQGPDQGYVLKLVGLFDDRLRLTGGEDRHDVEAGCVAVALKRASLFGRAPVVHDLEVAFRVFGYLDQAPAECVETRKRLFAGAGHHAYHRVRAIADTVSESSLRMPPVEVASAHSADWRSLLTFA
ncbi:MAG TPA: hypothetical protein VGA13_12985 [Acidimicrobiales bacterium]